MAVKNYLDKTGTLYEWVKIKDYLSSNYATQSTLNSLSTVESTLNSTQTSQLGSLSTENSTQNSLVGSMSASLSEQASEIESLAVAQSEAGGDVGSRLTSLSAENSTQASEIASLSASLSELNSSIASMSTAQSELDSTQNLSISSLATDTSLHESNITSLSKDNSEQEDLINSLYNITDSQTTDIGSLSTAASEMASEITVLGSEVASKTEIDDTATTTDNTWSASKISSVIAALNALKLAVVQTLPTTDISTTTIYLVPKTTAGTNNVYDEYVYYNNSWELIGSTEVDLSGYVQETDLVAITNAEIDAMIQ